MIIRRILSAALVPLAIILLTAGHSMAEATAEPQYFDFLTPLMFGARGDGKADDTNALRRAIYESDHQGKVLFFPSGYHFKVTGTLNFYQGEYKSYTLNMLGCIPVKKGSYSPKEYGGISVSKGVKLFHGAEITGSIDRMCITGQRDLNVHFFDNCVCNGLIIKESNISNFGALFYDTPLRHVSQIVQNNFYTLYYFSRNEKTSSGMTDSTISLNYINGGSEMNDNSCFEWGYYNGCTISNNFIDFYRTIYRPRAVAKQSFVGPLSYSNQYQIFRYFYYADEMFPSVTFTSTADAFNGNDPSLSEKVGRYKPETYKGKDGRVYEVPPYVAICHSAWNTTIVNAKIENHMKALVFVHSSLTEYEYNRFDVSFSGNNQYKAGQINYKQGDSSPFYNGGKHRQNVMKIEGIVETMDALPETTMGWSSSVQGRTVRIGEKVYRATNHLDGGKWKSTWDEIQ